LVNATLGTRVISIGNAAFSSCTGLTAVNFNATNCTGNPTAAVFSGCTNFTTLNVASNVTRIPDYIFDGCNKIANTLSVPSPLIYVGNYAFNNCSKILGQDLDLSGVNQVGNRAFYNCQKLDGYLQVKDTIGNYAFGLCIALDSVNIPSTAKKLGDDAFFSCLGLKTINYNAVSCNVMGSATLPVFSGCSGVNKLNIASDVTRIPDNAFYSCSGLTSVDIPASVTYIGSQAFKNCTGLTAFTAPENVTRIGEAAFSGCAALVDLSIPVVGRDTTQSGYQYYYPFGYIFGETSYTGGTSISQTYLRSGSSYSTKNYYLPTTLRNVTITKGTEIKSYSFVNCAMLTSVTLPSTLQYIREYAFQGCSGLTATTIPANVLTVGNYAFRNCTNLTELNFNPTNCTAMGNTSYPVFNGCTNLAKINIGNNVTRIVDYAFNGCTALDSIYSFATSVPAAYSNSFNGLTPANISVIVPCATLADYQDAEWAVFTDITEQCDNYSITVSAGANGAVSPSGNQTVAFGQDISFTFTPNANYNIDSVFVDAVYNPQAVETGSYIFENVNANHSISVIFSKPTITVSAGENGQISPADNQTVEIGSNLTFTFTPNTDYEVYQVLIDGVNNPAAVTAGSYTFENVTANHSISVQFEPANSVTIATVSNNAAGGSAIISEGGNAVESGVYQIDDNVTLYALPNINYSFTGWSDGNTQNPRVVVAASSLIYEANFDYCNSTEFLQQVEALKTDTTALKAQIAGLITDTTRLFVENTTLITDNARLYEQNMALIGDTVRLYNQNVVLFDEKVLLIADTIRLYEQVQNLNNTVDALQSHIVQLQADSTALQGEKAALENQLTTANSTISSLNSQITTLQDEKTALQNQLTTANSTISSLNSQITTLQSEKTVLENQLTTANSTISSLNSQISTLQGEKAALQNQLATANSTISSLNSQISTLQGEKTALENQLATANSTISSLNSQITTLQGEKAALENANSDLQTQLSAANITIVELTAALEGCQNSTGIAEVAAHNVSVYPNPAKQEIVIQSAQPVEKVEICDLAGKILKSELKIGESQIINVSSLLPGAYLVKIHTNAGVAVKKVVKE
jgi:predicted  nucleic acid-binding Zn-ribbon protein